MRLTTFLTIVIPVIMAFIAYFNSVRLERRKNRLERINMQLDEFYGPLLAIVQSSQQAWENFIAKHGNNPNFYKKEQNPSKEEVAEFHNWMSTVFMPNNEKLHDIIVNNTSLLVEDEIPPVLLGLLAHILEFRIIFDQRQDQHDEVAETKSKYHGKELLLYCEENFKHLKTEQIKIINGKLFNSRKV